MEIKRLKKFGILTFYDAQNYGAILQAYALQFAIEKLGGKPEFVRYYDQHDKKSTHKNGIKDYFNVLRDCNFDLFGFLKTYSVASNVSSKFSTFREKYLNLSQQAFYSKEELRDADELYDAFICGSDMIWSNVGQDLDIYFLKFASPNKRISYAPSLTGIDFFDAQRVEYLKRSIEGIRFLSCREEYGVDAIKKISGRDAFRAVDPSLLLTKEEWIQNLNIQEDNSYPYILCYMFGGVSAKINKMIKLIAKNNNLKIRYIPMCVKEYTSELKNGYSASYGPLEFVQLFSNASFVVTNSFHGLLFSLIFEKPFVVLHRSSESIWKPHEERMTNILSLVGLGDRYLRLEDSITSKYLCLDYSSKINNILADEREKSMAYLNNSIQTIINEESKPSADNKYKINRIDELDSSHCTGCSACIIACPKQCISMKVNEEGFWYPHVDESICTNCGFCSANCPEINCQKLNLPNSTYMAFGTNTMVEKSASGGAFISFANAIINSFHGVVFGSILEPVTFKCKHTFAQSIEELVPMQNSKYVQSEMGYSYAQCKHFLQNGRTVLFSGTPCQVAGLKRYLNYKYDNLFTIDIICHGVPSPQFFNRWIQEIKSKYGENPIQLLFRHKDDRKNRLSAFETKIVYETKTVYEAAYNSPYYLSFIRADSYRECCYRCKYAQESRVGDISIGDCDRWREYPHFYPEEAKSSIMINTEQGERLWKMAQNRFIFQYLDYEKECEINHQLRRPSVRKKIRDRIYRDLKELNWKSLTKKYCRANISPIKKILVRIIRYYS